ncbi:MAG: hypothetical protein Q4F67_03530 [Propionibacteriaceae bacterium]|nr:hypothetical protein [Propionibacteriaceae bacterium]
MEPLVVRLNAHAQHRHRSFWTGPIGTIALIAPGLIIMAAGGWLWITQAEGATHIFGAVTVFSGLYASYAGWDHRRKAERGAEEDPLAFVIADDGVTFPRGKRFEWHEVRFVVTEEQPPRLLVTPVGAAYAIADLDHEPGEIAAALAASSGGAVVLEHRSAAS